MAMFVLVTCSIEETRSAASVSQQYGYFCAGADAVAVTLLPKATAPAMLQRDGQPHVKQL